MQAQFSEERFPLIPAFSLGEKENCRAGFSILIGEPIWRHMAMVFLELP
jgi:hypothetical protein